MADPGAPTPITGDLTPIDGYLPERRKDPAESFVAALEAHERVKAMHFRAKMKVWIPVITGILAAISGGTWYGLERKPEDAPPTLPSDLKADVKKAQSTADENARKLEQVGRGLVDTRIEMVEGISFIADKIDKAHPKAPSVDKPDSLVEAEKEIGEIKKQRAVEELFEASKK